MKMMLKLSYYDLLIITLMTFINMTHLILIHISHQFAKEACNAIRNEQRRGLDCFSFLKIENC